jgi:adenylate cyclase
LEIIHLNDPKKLRKMKKTFTISVVMFSCFLAFGQVNVDSLRGSWKDESKHDTLRINALFSLFKDYYIVQNPDSALVLAEEAIQFSKEKVLAKQAEKAHFNKGLALLKMDKIPEAIQSFESCFSAMEKAGKIAEMAKFQTEAAVSLVRVRAYDAALTMFENSLTSYKRIDDKMWIARIQGNLGIVHATKGNYPKAIEYYLKSLKLKEEIKDSAGVAMTLNSLGNLNKEIGDLDKALVYLNQGLNLFQNIKHDMGIGSARSNIGEVYALKNEHEKAIEYFENSIAIKEITGHQVGIAVSLLNKGNSLYELGRYDEAFADCDKSEQLRNSIGMKDDLESVYILKGKIKLAKKDFLSAKAFGEKALELSRNSGVSKLEMDAYELLTGAYQGLKNYQKALEFQLSYNKLKDKVFEDESKRKVLEQGFEYDYQRKYYADSLSFASKEAIKNLEIEKQQANINRQQIALGSAIGGFLLILLLAHSIYQGKKRSDVLLLNILPSEVAKELKKKGHTDAKEFDQVTVLFTDFIGFTELSSKLSASDLVTEIDVCFKAFDHIIGQNKLEKIKTIGDAYMAAGGLHTPRISEPADVVRAGLEMQAFIFRRKAENEMNGRPSFSMRVGIHTGPVVAGIVGVKKFQYDIWGDTVNTASRMESSGTDGKVNISQSTYELIKDIPEFKVEPRGKLETKGKGLVKVRNVLC